jgi:hypothetical protein
MQQVQPRPKLQYKQPRRVNAVSLTILLIFGLVGWAVYGFWPAFSLRSNVESELADALPGLWRMNHQPEPSVRPQVLALKRSTIERLRKMGVKDKNLEVAFERNRKIVAIQARFKTTFSLPGLERVFTVTFEPRVATDAARVEW